MNYRVGFALALLSAALTLSAPAYPPSFQVSFPASRSTKPVDGRVLLILSTDSAAEPRMQINDTPASQMIFGVTVDHLASGQAATLDATAVGYPVPSLSAVKPGTYYVQAVLNLYETFHRADGTAVKLPMDRGEGQHWNLAPGNFYSRPQRITIDPNRSVLFKISMERLIPPIVPPKDTKYIRHIRIQSALLTKFWGRPMYLGAHILLPEGFDGHPEAHYPIAINHGHFPEDFGDFRTEPPDPNVKPEYSQRFHVPAYNRIEQTEAYNAYKQWISPGFPRLLVVEIQHANPYYDDSYAVDSANLGPYGEAIETELIPYIEKKFRGIGQGWARFLYGGSTGGWEALAVQVFYPEHYNGAFAACPDPVDFRAFTNINLYEAKNAYYLEGAHKTIEQPAMRDYLGNVSITQRGVNSYEAALGDHGRSGEQYDIWQAVFSPVGPDGYPAKIFDKQTGVIVPKVAAYWREHYDLSHILARDWPTLGPKLRGKIHIYVGSADTYYLNDAVYYIEDFLKSTSNPPYDGEVRYGDRAEHCWNGDPHLPNYLSRLHYNTMYIPKMLEQMEKTAPPGADLKSWRY